MDLPSAFYGGGIGLLGAALVPFLSAVLGLGITSLVLVVLACALFALASRATTSPKEVA